MSDFNSIKSEWLKEFSNRLTDRISAFGMTQKELAINTGISKANISMYCRGMICPSALHLIMLAKELWLDIDYMICADLFEVASNG